MSEFGTLIPSNTVGSINDGLHPVSEATMRSLLGAPKGTLTRNCQDNLASDTVQRLLETRNFGLFSARGITPALDSLQTIFDAVKAQNPALFAAIGRVGMLCVRLRKPTSGADSTEASNHAWGTAIDIAIDQAPFDTNPDGMVQQGVADLIPFFNDEGWFSGVGFHDDSHFEVADETIQAWALEGRFDPPTVAPPIGASDPARSAFDFFVKTGWSEAQAAGLIGNIQLESSFDATIANPSNGAFGLFQWLGSRQDDFARKFGHKIQQSSFDEQLTFANFELLEGKMKTAGDALKQAQTAREAGIIVCQKYEIPNDPDGTVAAKRGESAETFFAEFA
jgi:hypothetical protein